MSRRITERMSTLSRSVSRHWREITLAGIALLSLAIIVSVGSIPQSHAYHFFADNRNCFSIRNFANVSSNIFFLIFGVSGLLLCVRSRDMTTRLPWSVFFLGVGLTAFGSVYYHLDPQDATLVWDRLPIVVAFMALYCALLNEHLWQEPKSSALIALVCLGIASVIWWHVTDDLRFYIWVQVLPLITLPFVVAVFPPPFTLRVNLLYALGCYALAKIAELYDAEIFRTIFSLISGHTLKHLLASAAVFFIYLMLLRRKVLKEDIE